MATKSDVKKALFPVGSYVSGDCHTLQTFSTSILMTNGWAQLMQPEDFDGNFISQIVVFPYHIHGTITGIELEEFENICKCSLVTLLLIHFLNGKPIRCILMETILACNGATLTDSFFNYLASLCNKLSISIILDEILTCGRTGTMLHWEKLPVNFKNRLHISLWASG